MGRRNSMWGLGAEIEGGVRVVRLLWYQHAKEE